MEPPVLSVPPPNLMPPPPAPDIIATCNRATNNAPSKITLKCGGKSFPILPCTTNNNNNATAVNKRRKKNNEEPERNHNCKTPPPVAASSPPPPPTLHDLNQTREKPNHDLGISVDRINHIIEDDQDELPEPTPLVVAAIAATSPETHRTSISGVEGGNGGGIHDGTGGGRVWDGRIRSSRNNKKERAKFSYSLTESEIKEDFLKMLDPKEKPPRRQKKRPKDLQKQFDSLVPGFHLTEIKADLYKVCDDSH